MGIESTVSKADNTNKTPLALALANSKRPQATPLEVFKLARRRWLEGKRISIGQLAQEVGVSRGTLYRWVGKKDLLMDEIFWSLTGPAFERAVRETPGHGIDHIVNVHRNFMVSILSFPPMQQFIMEDSGYAFRILTNYASGVSQRIVKLAAEHLREQEAKGHIRLHSPAEKLAEIFILANQGILYSDVISGRSPAIDKACAIIRLLLTSSEAVEQQVSCSKSLPTD
jgi:AcrR family transcriptional regulator